MNVNAKAYGERTSERTITMLTAWSTDTRRVCVCAKQMRYDLNNSDISLCALCILQWPLVRVRMHGRNLVQIERGSGWHFRNDCRWLRFLLQSKNYNRQFNFICINSSMTRTHFQLIYMIFRVAKVCKHLGNNLHNWRSLARSTFVHAHCAFVCVLAPEL